MIPGYSEVKAKMFAQAYFQGVVSRRIKDPTLSMQMKVGFEPRALLANYINDPVSDNYAVLLVLEASKCVPGATFQDVGGACAERYVGRGNPPAGAAGRENSFFHRRPEPFILIFPHALKRLAISRRDHDVMLDAGTAGVRIRDGQPDVLGSRVPECE